MSDFVGSWNFEGPQSGNDFIERARGSLSRGNPDGTASYCDKSIAVLYAAFYTDCESRRDPQLFRSRRGLIFTWDGRLDNRDDFIDHAKPLSRELSDVAIVGNAHERWGDSVFARLTGDWVISIWNPSERTLTLAKDAIGVRHLYWHISPHHVLWSTSLDAIKRLDGCSHSLDEDYIAGWFSQLPAQELTPYSSINSVAPGSAVQLRPQQCPVRNFETLNRTQRIHYREDREYEEHFRIVFAESVRRRLRSDSPVLAELSGGMDSSSIVCVADRLIAEQKTDVPRLDTVSFYDASEPNWDERPYFTTIEKRRGRVGCHIDVGLSNRSVPGLDGITSGIIPSDVALDPSEEAFRQCLSSNGNRVVLSGIGGDEVMGGVPSPIPELSDLLVKARLCSFLSRGIEWALAARQPLINLFASTCMNFLPTTRRSLIESCPAAEWLRPEFIRRHIPALRGYEERIHFFGQPPSYQENVAAIGSLQRQLECSSRRTPFPHEVRYPFLDKDLLQFLFAIPREQIVRPGRRRSLMRRALPGIVPQEILERKRKAYILHGPMTAIAESWPALDAFTAHMVGEEMGIVDADKFRKALLRIREGIAVPISPVFRTLLVEQWLRGQVQRSAENAAQYEAVARCTVTQATFREQAAHQVSAS